MVYHLVDQSWQKLFFDQPSADSRTNHEVQFLVSELRRRTGPAEIYEPAIKCSTASSLISAMLAAKYTC